MGLKNGWFFIFVVVILLGGLFFTLSMADRGRAKLKTTLVVPDFTLTALDGDSYTLSEYANGIVILHFWATWCPPCRRELPSLEKFYRYLEDEPIDVITVALDRGGKKDVAPFVGKFGYTFPVLIDEAGKVGRDYKIVSIPTTFVLVKGEVVKKFVGSRDWQDETLRKEILSLVDNY